ncbi:hypothetical protein Salat_1163700 [Sesamum alatum]|uniref:Uncharacterized protein n=1 Tax=Sesamum alatum TaxID=300844 RepID=A0AAE1YEH6_9LAMI|nr:hypothetical protein Salat_1163700 [Sesamum alatum]
MCPPQAHYFYNRYFNKDMDDVFIHTLVANHNKENGAPNNGPNVGAVCAAQRAVNGRFVSNINLDCLQENPFALAYRWRPEPKWNELKALFGEPDNEGMVSSSENASLGSDSTSQATILDIQDYDAEVSSASSVPKSA